MSSVVMPRRGRSKGNVFVSNETKEEKERREAREREMLEQRSRDASAGRYDFTTGRLIPKFDE